MCRVPQILSASKSGTQDARPAASPEAAEELLRERGVRFVTFDDWKRLDALEVARGEKAGRIRDRFSRVEEMLEAIDRARSASS
jgi:hypothetical protein